MTGIIWVYLLLWQNMPTAQNQFYNVQGIAAMPEWAQKYLSSVDPQDAPMGAKAWCVLHDELWGLDQKGELMVRERLIYWVLDQSAAMSLSAFAVHLSEDVGEVRRIEGYHLPRFGPLQKRNTQDMVTFGHSMVGLINRGTSSVIQFDYVSKGSMIAVETLRREKNFLGNRGVVSPCDRFPTRFFTIQLVRENELGQREMGDQVRIDVEGLSDWGLVPIRDTAKLTLTDLPGVGDAPFKAPHASLYPQVTIQFMEKDAQQDRYRSWDSYASWYWRVFEEAALEKAAPPLGPVEEKTLAAMMDTLRSRISYQQVYLSEARGFVPAKGKDVLRRAYGDCKDMGACFAHEGVSRNVRVYPTLANVAEGPFLSEANVPSPVFNHLIVAVPLVQPLGLPAEIVAKGQRYLVIDTTATETAFGFLPRSYLGRSVLICTEKGAVWAAIPSTALEPGGVTYRLKGGLDASNRLTGTFSLEEKGNVHGFRTFLKQYGTTFVQSRIQGLFPPLAELEHLGTRLLEEGTVRSEYRIVWPEFLKKAGVHFVLPEQIMADRDFTLRVGGAPREMPILVADEPLLSWHVDLMLATPLKPAQGNAAYQDAIWDFQWRATGGSRLLVDYQWSAKQSIFKRNQTAAGVKAFSAIEEAYQRLRKQESLLFAP